MHRNLTQNFPACGELSPIFFKRTDIQSLNFFACGGPSITSLLSKVEQNNYKLQLHTCIHKALSRRILCDEQTKIRKTETQFDICLFYFLDLIEFCQKMYPSKAVWKKFRKTNSQNFENVFSPATKKL